MRNYKVTVVIIFILLTYCPKGVVFAADKDSSVIVKEKDGAQMVLIPAGEFVMGSKEWFNDEQPSRKVYLDNFYIDKYEVTNAQYKKFITETGHRIPINHTDPRYDLWKKDGSFPPEIAQKPVVNVSWEDAVAYAKWAGKRLPTEAEWEKAARGTDQRRYPWGNNDPDAKCANFARPWEGEKTFVDVTSMKEGASPYGVFHMAGNVSEWVDDLYDHDFYKTGLSKNPKASYGGSYRVIRGGSWMDPDFYLRCTNRDFDMPGDRHGSIGFRCVRQP